MIKKPDHEAKPETTDARETDRHPETTDLEQVHGGIGRNPCKPLDVERD